MYISICSAVAWTLWMIHLGFWFLNAHVMSSSIGKDCFNKVKWELIEISHFIHLYYVKEEWSVLRYLIWDSIKENRHIVIFFIKRIFFTLSWLHELCCLSYLYGLCAIIYGKMNSVIDLLFSDYLPNNSKLITFITI